MIYLLDTNILIDGRILNIVKTGLLDGAIFIPEYVVSELSRMADSTSEKRSSSGRIGLENLRSLMTDDAPIRSQIITWDYSRDDHVDDLILRTAKALRAVLFTVDANLQMRCDCEDVRYLSINEVLSAMRPVYRAGMVLEIVLSAKGKARAQALGHTDEGTLIVVEDGDRYIGLAAVVEVTNVLMTKNGHMVFARVIRPIVTMNSEN